VVVLVLIIGINSIGLGYALAVWLGYGPGSGPAVEWLQNFWPWEPPVSALPSAADPSAMGSDLPDLPDLPPERDAEPDLPAAELESLKPLEPLAAEPPVVEMPVLAQSVLGLNEVVLRSLAKVQEIEGLLRAAQGNYEVSNLRQCAKELGADCETYLAAQREATERLHQQAIELETQEPLAEQIELANLEQSALTETVIAHLQQLDFESDLAATAEHLLAEIHDLHAGRHRLHDAQDQAFVALARRAGQLGALDAQLTTDPLTRLPNRTGLEARLDEWLSAEWSGSHTLSAALVDVDEFGQLNRTHGSQAGDQVVQQLGHSLQEAAGAEGLVGRFTGQRFLLLARNVAPAELAARVDQVRRQFEHTPCTCGEVPIEATVSAVIAAVGVDETPTAFGQRLDGALAELRNRGPNQAALCTPAGLQPVSAEQPVAV
jgi:diguanylate cyclase (GGDEF)-like protein